MNIIKATKQNNIKTVIELIKGEDTNINLRGEYGNTALINASRKGNLEIVKILIESKANINLQNEYGNTALICASKNGCVKTVIELIKAGANINLQNGYGYSALIYANSNGYIKIVKELIKAGANLDNKFIENIKKYDVDLLKLLVNNNFNIGLEYVKKFNKEEDIKYYIKLLIINLINKFQYLYEKGLINIILNYYI
jgi:ankyrin repeat protein